MKEKEMIEWIKESSYEELLSKYRFSTSDNPFFQGEVGEYFVKMLKEKKEQLKK